MIRLPVVHGYLRINTWQSEGPGMPARKWRAVTFELAFLPSRLKPSSLEMNRELKSESANLHIQIQAACPLSIAGMETFPGLNSISLESHIQRGDRPASCDFLHCCRSVTSRVQGLAF